MYFNSLLDIVLGEREILHIMECPLCHFEEIYYKDPTTNKQLGRACESCNFVQKFEFEHDNKHTKKP